MSKHPLMQNPFYAHILFAIERRIQLADVLAAKRGLPYTDMTVRAALVLAANTAKGRPPAPPRPNATPRERLVFELIDAILKARTDVEIVEPGADNTDSVVKVPTDEWLDSLAVVKESCSRRGDGKPGSRAYLDYLHTFMAQAVKP